MARQKFTVEELVENLHKFNINESIDGIRLAISRPIDRTCDALKISKRSLYRYLKTDKKNQNNVPGQDRRGRRRKLDDFDIGVIRRTMHELFCQKEVTTLDLIKQRLSERDVNIGRNTVHRYLKESGFEFGRRGRDR